jgi:hypothetical protein
MALKNLYLTVPVGQSVRDFLVLGIVQKLLDLLPKFQIVLLTPAHNVPDFAEVCPRSPRLLIRRMELVAGSQNWRLIHWRRRVLRNRTSVRMVLNWELQRLKLPAFLMPTFQELPPSVVVSTHPLAPYDYDVVMWARRLGIQTLGVVKSWDNVGKGLSTHTHLLSVWNPFNKDEAVQLLRYYPEEVEINGAPSFDAYYDPSYNGFTRDEFFSSIGLDPGRPIITLATGGPMDKQFQGRDETHLVDDILRMIEQSTILKKAQLVIRLHPVSRLEYFWKYWNRPDIRFSFASYMPGIMWCPNRQDLVEQTNLLKHSDVIVTPASSWVLEAAIFDTPTIVPVYSDLQPDHAAAQFDNWTLTRHFKPLAQNNWVQITRSQHETRTAIEEALTQPQKFARARQEIVNHYVYYSSNGSCGRVANWIAKIAETAEPGNPQGF